MYKFAGIIINNESVQLDKVFTYEIPDYLEGKLKIGNRVHVPFGKKNSYIEGFIIDFYESLKDNIFNIKKIKTLSENIQWFCDSDVELIHFMREKYLCTYIDCIKTIIPAGTTSGVKSKYSEVLYVNNALEGNFFKEPYTSIWNFVKDNSGRFNKNYLNKTHDFSLSSINTLLKHGFLSSENIVVRRYNNREYNAYDSKILNADQIVAVDDILNRENRLSLIHGVTGSGKTEVYLTLVSEMLKANKDSIILVPEISLTPQIVERFKGRFGKNISVFHSKLSQGERYDEWMRIKNGEVKVAIGARSAIFLPFSHLGLIVIDEEHESSYKSESSPKYDTREIAEFKCKQFDCKVVLGSATPSIETYYKALNKSINLINMTKRADNAQMPSIEVVDMRQELLENNKSIFSRSLYSKIKTSLIQNEQIILFLNRRGHSTFVSCRQCGYVFKCEKCDISMTYHSEHKYLNCHYCGSTTPVSNVCPKCGSKYVKYFGAGTEKIEAEIKRYFPGVSVLRMDLDTTRKKDSHEMIYSDFKNKKAQILVGTQMIAKGLDFHDVTLVGVLAADLSLNLPDYKAAERTFQLLTQVSGRAGRGQKPGNVVIQTYSPEHYSIQYSKTYDYIGFFKEEIKIRNDMNYPPFSELMLINLSSKNEDLLIKTAQTIGIELKTIIGAWDKIVMLGPCPCAISKIKESFRWQILFKGELTNDVIKLIKTRIFEMTVSIYNEVRISIDINPNSLL